MATVTGLVLLFALTSGAVIWLARDVNRTVANRSAAQSIAFQAARSGAQQLGSPDLRQARHADLDRDRVVTAATATASELFEGYHVDGAVVRVSVADTDVVEVEVRIVDPAGDVIGVAAARAEVVP